MEILQVVGSLVCSRRVDGLGHWDLRVLRDRKGGHVVATDPVGARPGNWVFTSSGSAARYAMGDARVLTDLTVAGIIDQWEEAAPDAGPSAAPDAAPGRETNAGPRPPAGPVDNAGTTARTP